MSLREFRHLQWPIQDYQKTELKQINNIYILFNQ